MSEGLGAITVDPQGATVTVDVLFNGTRTTAYSSAAGTETRSLPLEISAATEFYVPRRASYTVVVESEGVEVLRESVGVSAQPAHDPTVSVRSSDVSLAEAQGGAFGGGGGGGSTLTPKVFPVGGGGAALAHYTISEPVNVDSGVATWLTIDTVVDAQPWAEIVDGYLYFLEWGLYLVNFAVKFTDDTYAGTYRSTIVDLETDNSFSIWQGGGPVTAAPGALPVTNFGWLNNWPMVWVPPSDGPVYAYTGWQVAHDAGTPLTLDPAGVLIEIRQLAVFS